MPSKLLGGVQIVNQIHKISTGILGRWVSLWQSCGSDRSKDSTADDQAEECKGPFGL